FEVNAGQTDKRVKFVSRMSGGNLFLTHKEAVLTLKTTTSQNAKTAKSEIAEIGDSSVRAAFSSVRFQLLDANQNPEVIGQDELAGKSNYFIGDNPAGWRTNIPNYAKVRYRNVYRGIDLTYYGNQQQLEYDFEVAPHADPKVIRLSFGGASKVD